MNVNLLDKTRKINKLLHNCDSSKVMFNDICDVLSDILKSNVIVISKNRKILGINKFCDVEIISEYIGTMVGEYIDADLNERLLGILSTKENVNLMTLGFEKIDYTKYFAIIIPIDIAGERLGTLFCYRVNKSYDIDDIILSEYGNTVVGLEMIRSVNEENQDKDRKIKMVDLAINSLSYYEKRAIICVLYELNGNEGILNASKLADKMNITRSVMVNAIRKFEIARIIKTHSKGMRGTYIKVLNDKLFDVLHEMDNQENVDN